MSAYADLRPFPRTIVGPFPEPPEEDEDPEKDRIPKDDHIDLLPGEDVPRIEDLLSTRGTTPEHEPSPTIKRWDERSDQKLAAAEERLGRIKDVLYPVGLVAATAVAFLYLNHKLPGISVIPPTHQHSSSAVNP